MGDIAGVIAGAADLAMNATSKERTDGDRDVATGNKMVLYLTTGVMLKEYWVATGRASVAEGAVEPLRPYVNPLMFRLGQGTFSRIIKASVRFPFVVAPAWLLRLLQKPCEYVFRAFHTSDKLQPLRQIIGWQHSPQSRGDMSTRPTGHQYSWAAWIDEFMNFLMILEHMEVIFPLEPRENAAQCLEILFAHQHLMWWRFNIRVMPSEEWYLSPVHVKGPRQPMVRVDFVAPTQLLELPSGGASLASQLHHRCHGWRNHWGKGMHTAFSDMRHGDPAAFNEVAARLDPVGKFRPRGLPVWLDGSR